MTVLSRPESTNTFSSNVRVVKKEYSDPSLFEAFEGQDAVVSFVTVTALLDQLKFIDLAAEAGVKRFIPSELGVNTLNPKAQELVFFYQQKRTVLDHLEATAKKVPSFSWTGLATGPVFDWVRHPSHSCAFHEGDMREAHSRNSASKLPSWASTLKTRPH